VSRTRDVVVIGGGAVGAACARELAISGRRVLVLEPGGETGQAWRAAAGMLAPQIEAEGSDPLLRFAVAAREHYAALAASLRESTGVDIGLWQEGIARVAADRQEAEELRTKVTSQQQEGYIAAWLETGEVQARWPWLGPTAGALWSERDGALDPVLLVQALLEDLRRLGGVVLQERVTAIEQAAGRISAVVTDKGTHATLDVIVAAGAWSGQLGGLPRIIPVLPIRGQMAALPWPAGVGRAIVYHRDSYLLARGNEAILGSTMEQVGFNPQVTPEGVARIFAASIALCPGLTRAKVRRTWAGLRPVTPDGLPIIGPEPRLPGLWYATGHGRNGILLAGLTGRVIRELLDHQDSLPEVRAFSATRF
jgi:glycine oxidase